MTLATLVPVGSILSGVIVIFFIGLAAGGFAQRVLVRDLRAVQIRRAITTYLRTYHLHCPAVHPVTDDQPVRVGGVR
jgi:hypothetical protein